METTKTSDVNVITKDNANDEALALLAVPTHLEDENICDITVSATSTESSCQSNGTITVTVEGPDIAYIRMTDIEYSIKPVTQGGYSTPFAHVEGGLLTNVPAGSYTV